MVKEWNDNDIIISNETLINEEEVLLLLILRY